MEARCAGRPRCAVAVTDAELRTRSPCPTDVTWYLQVSYACVTGQRFIRPLRPIRSCCRDVIDAARIVCGKRLCNVPVSVRPSVCLSRSDVQLVCPGANGDIDLQISIDICCRRRSSAAGSVSALIRGGSTQTYTDIGCLWVVPLCGGAGGVRGTDGKRSAEK